MVCYDISNQDQKSKILLAVMFLVTSLSSTVLSSVSSSELALAATLSAVLALAAPLTTVAVLGVFWLPFLYNI